MGFRFRRYLVQLLALYSLKTISSHDVQLQFCAYLLGVNLQKIDDETAMANLIVLSEQISFIFDKNEKLTPYFLQQKFPKLYVFGIRYDGYIVNTSFDTLTCSLTALQFIEAQELLSKTGEKLPLLAAILYCPPPYNSEKAHALADKFTALKPKQLLSIAFNFQAFVGYLFHKTHFSILMQRKETPKSEISIGLSDMLYNLSSDGLGDAENIERMPVIKYLSIMRKKLIESVRAMNDAKVELAEIADKTGLDFKTINKILQ